MYSEQSLRQQKKILHLVDKNQNNRVFIPQKFLATDEDIEYIERKMGGKLPLSYKWFIKTLGAGGVGESFVEGVGTEKDRYTIVKDSKDLMQILGLDAPTLFLGLYKEGCLSLLSLCDEECEDSSVSVLQETLKDTLNYNDTYKRFSSFYHYLLDIYKTYSV